MHRAADSTSELRWRVYARSSKSPIPAERSLGVDRTYATVAATPHPTRLICAQIRFSLYERRPSRLQIPRPPTTRTAGSSKLRSIPSPPCARHTRSANPPTLAVSIRSSGTCGHVRPRGCVPSVLPQRSTQPRYRSQLHLDSRSRARAPIFFVLFYDSFFS